MPRAKKAPLDQEEHAWQAWVSQSLGDLLALSPTLEEPVTRQQVRERLMSAMQKTPPGKLRYFPCHAQSVPRCSLLLCICAAMGLSPTEVLFGEQAIPSPEVMALAGSLQGYHRPYTRQEQAQFFQAIEETRTSSEYPPLSLAAVARRLGCPANILSRCHPEACRVISTRYQDYLRQLKRDRIAGYREQMRQIAIRLRAEGKPITKGYVASYLEKPGVLRAPEMREALKEIQAQLEQE
jgi:hypothetical protein